MKKSRISNVLLASAAALSSGLLLPAATATAQVRGEPIDGYAQNDANMSFEQFRDSVAQLREAVAQDEGFRARYLANPREVLTEAGLPVNLQLEMMRDDGLAYGPAFKAMDCICTQTCLKTN
ncbi:MAG: hypothetical protein HY075_12490 [Deltaproteobacteria bacterium]|nr:hypothetical protein [Deltaproteobacteria bacterium]